MIDMLQQDRHQDVLIYNADQHSAGGFLFVSHRVRKGDHEVQSGRPKEGNRSILTLEPTPNGLNYRINCRSYGNYYLFCSWDEYSDENKDRLVEAKPDPTDDRTIFSLVRLEPYVFSIICPATGLSSVYILPYKDGSDNYVGHAQGAISRFMLLSPLDGPIA